MASVDVVSAVVMVVVVIIMIIMMSTIICRTLTVADPATTWSLWGWRIHSVGPLPCAARLTCTHCDYESRDLWRLVSSNAQEISVGAPVGGVEEGINTARSSVLPAALHASLCPSFFTHVATNSDGICPPPPSKQAPVTGPGLRGRHSGFR